MATEAKAEPPADAAETPNPRTPRRAPRTPRPTTDAESGDAAASTPGATRAASASEPEASSAPVAAPRPPRRAPRSRSTTPPAEKAETEAEPSTTDSATKPESEPEGDTSGGERRSPTSGSRTRGRGGSRRGSETTRPQAIPPRTGETVLPRNQTTQPPRSTGPAPRGGSVESLIARQNVLFEEFTSQQAQTLRDLQRSIGSAGAGGGQTAVGLPKVGIFLDVPNLIYAAELAGARIHFGKLLDYLTEGRQLVRATAYAPITDDPATRFESQRFVAPVINHGYKVVTKAWKRFADGGMKANFDIELAVDIMTMSDRLDIVVLMSGDGDFRRAVELVESKGVRVEVVAFAASTAMELRVVADSFIDLSTILNLVSE